MEYRILPPSVSDTGKWQLEYRENFVWTVEVHATKEDAVTRQHQMEEEDDRQSGRSGSEVSS